MREVEGKRFWKSLTNMAVPGKLGVHDVGGVEEAMRSAMPQREFDSPIQFWERRTHAMLGLLCRK